MFEVRSEQALARGTVVGCSRQETSRACISINSCRQVSVCALLQCIIEVRVDRFRSRSLPAGLE